MRKMMRRVLAGVAAAAMSLSLAAPMVASAAVEKLESVYVNADAFGTPKSVTVSNQLKGTGELTGTFKDKSNLKDIKNVKGDETFEQSGEDLTWNLNGADIFYQGTTDKQLPVSVKLTYFLEGKEVNPKDVVGKSGKMKITIEYINNETVAKEIDGKNEKINPPFLMATGMILDSDVFSNVKIDGTGKVIDSGSNNIVVCIGLPGLKDSLSLPEKIMDKIGDKLNSKFTVECDVKDFEMKNTFTYASANILGGMSSDSDSDSDLDLSKLDDKIDSLKDATSKLGDGTKKLADGTKEFNDGVKELESSLKKYTTEGVKKLTAGISTLAANSPKLTKGVGEYVDGVDSLAKGITPYVKGVEQVAGGVDLLNTGLSSISADQITALTEGLKSFAAGVSAAVNKDDMKKLSDGAKAVSDGIGTVNKGLGTLKSSYDQEDTAITTLKTTLAANEEVLKGLKTAKEAGAAGLDKAIETLEKTTAGEKAAIAGLETIAKAQKEGVEKIEDATSAKGALGSGASQVSDGVTKLTDGLVAMGDNKNVQALSVGLNLISSKLPELLAGVKALKAGTDKLTANDKKILAGASALVKASKTMKKTVKKLGAGMTQLGNGAKELDKATDQVNDGVGKLASAGDKLAEGARSLDTGFDKFRKKAIDKLLNIFDEDIKTIIDRVEAVKEAGEEYTSFSGSAVKGGEVKFIIETESVKADED
ncbi:MAG: hypothetical protein K5639_06880 [Eubacterium sp.]|nr:hypothetical protein [Eubacterium sp.]